MSSEQTARTKLSET